MPTRTLHPASTGGAVTEEHGLDVLASINFDGTGEMFYSVEPEQIAADNLRRAGFAITAITAYAERTGVANGEDLATIISDLLGDLRHFCDAIGADFHGLSDRGRNHYVPELAGEL